MDLFAHPITQSSVHNLMLLDLILSGKRAADDHRFEVRAVAGNFDMITSEAGGNIIFDLVRGNHSGTLNV